MTKPDPADVLASVNALRLLHGVGEPLTKLPKGHCGDPYSCVLTVALKATEVCGLFTDSPIYKMAHDGPSLILPTLLVDFANAFDAHLYPELIA